MIEAGEKGNEGGGEKGREFASCYEFGDRTCRDCQSVPVTVARRFSLRTVAARRIWYEAFESLCRQVG